MPTRCILLVEVAAMMYSGLLLYDEDERSRLESKSRLGSSKPRYRYDAYPRGD
jgi:hypothetical protein